MRSHRDGRRWKRWAHAGWIRSTRYRDSWMTGHVVALISSGCGTVRPQTFVVPPPASFPPRRADGAAESMSLHMLMAAAVDGDPRWLRQRVRPAPLATSQRPRPSVTVSRRSRGEETALLLLLKLAEHGKARQGKAGSARTSERDALRACVAVPSHHLIHCRCRRRRCALSRCCGRAAVSYLIVLGGA